MHSSQFDSLYELTFVFILIYENYHSTTDRPTGLFSSCRVTSSGGIHVKCRTSTIETVSCFHSLFMKSIDLKPDILS